jgi:hypothetical protein
MSVEFSVLGTRVIKDGIKKGIEAEYIQCSDARGIKWWNTEDRRDDHSLVLIDFGFGCPTEHGDSVVRHHLKREAAHA